jgi:hypothetical protein
VGCGVGFWADFTLKGARRRCDRNEGGDVKTFQPRFIALLDLDVEAQEAIIAVGEKLTLGVLSDSPHLKPRAAKQLLCRNGRGRFRNALRRIDDLELIEKYATGGGTNAGLLARNIHTPVAVLDRIAKSRTQASFWALANPLTSEDVRRSELSVGYIEEATALGQSNSDHLSRAMELALANPWLGEIAEQLPSRVQRALLIDPRRSADTVERLTGSNKRLWPMVKLIPEGDLWEMSIEKLTTAVCSTTALVALERDELSLREAKLFCCTWDEDAEAPVLARYVKRFGVEVLDGLKLSGTKVATTAQLEPGAWYQNAGVARTKTAARILQADAVAWQAYFALAAAGHTDAQEMAEAAVRVAA